jgi:hypothetical protein
MMDRKRWPRYIEVSSNIAVLVVAVALLGAIVSTRWWPSPGNAKFENGLQKEQAFALPSIDYRTARRTLVAVLSRNSILIPGKSRQTDCDSRQDFADLRRFPG